MDVHPSGSIPRSDRVMSLPSTKDEKSLASAKRRLALALLANGGLNNLALSLAKIMNRLNCATDPQIDLSRTLRATAQLTRLSLDMLSDSAEFQIISATTAQELVGTVVSHLQTISRLKHQGPDEGCVDGASTVDIFDIKDMKISGDIDKNQLWNFPYRRVVYKILSPWAWLFRQRLVQCIDLALAAKV